jgi:amidase
MVTQLKSMGAVIVGKTNTPEIGLWPFTEGPAFGATRNPWNLDHTPGGSSGGAAAAVAAGLVAAAIGSDGAGSVRIPAAWTGLVGIKPQRGRISTMPEPESFNGLTVLGPLARTVADAALLLDVLSAPVAGERHRPPAPRGTFAAAAERHPGTLRIGLALNIPFSGAPATLDPEIASAVEGCAGTLEDLGHEVEALDAPYGLWPGVSLVPRANVGVRNWAQRVPDPSELDHRVRGAARQGAAMRPLMPVARAAEVLARRRFAATFKRFDVLLTPTTATPPLPVGQCEGLGAWGTDKAIVAACPYAWPWNVLGWPGINVPAGFTEAGLPIGAQLLGPANSESALISLAAQLEGSRRWHELSPPVPAAAIS